MAKAISNTSPLLYLYRLGRLDLLRVLFSKVLAVPAVILELETGRKQGYDVPQVEQYEWVQVVRPSHVPSEWLATDLGKGELETMALGLEHPEKIVLLDDALARRIAKAAGLEVWGTLRVLLEAKKNGKVQALAPLVDELRESGMWISEDLRQRILNLANE